MPNLLIIFACAAGLAVAIMVIVFLTSRPRHRDRVIPPYRQEDFEGYPEHGQANEPSSNGSSGRYRLVKASDIVFTLATICERLPPLKPVGETPSHDDIMLHEDDWCQVELVAADDYDYMIAQLARLRRFKLKMREPSGCGWKECYLRPDHPTEILSLGIGFDELQDALAGSSPNGVVIFRSIPDPVGTARGVLGGFSFNIGGRTMLYGHQVNGNVASFGLHLCFESESDMAAVAASLERISRLSPLVLVDWNTNFLTRLDDKRGVNAWLTEGM